MENNNNPERAALRPALLPLTFIFHDVEVGGWSAKRAVSRLASSSCVPDFWSVFFFFCIPLAYAQLSACNGNNEKVPRELELLFFVERERKNNDNGSFENIQC